MFHIRPGTLRRHPVLGVIIGCASAGFVVFLLQSGITEARQLFAQKSPTAVTVHEAAELRDIRWIALTDGTWHCERAITLERPPGLVRWIFGRVESTEVPITGAAEGELLIACFEGPVSCDARSAQPLTGVIGSTEIFTSRPTLRRWRDTGARIVVLNAGASPRYALIMLVGLIGVVILGLAFAAYHARRMMSGGADLPRVPASLHGPLHPH